MGVQNAWSLCAWLGSGTPVSLASTSSVTMSQTHGFSIDDFNPDTGALLASKKKGARFSETFLPRAIKRQQAG